MITVLRFIYAVAVFLWEQWRKDGEDAKKGGGRPYNFIIALLMVFVVATLAYTYMYYKSTQVTIGQCVAEVSKLGKRQSNAPVVLDYPMVHRIVNVSVDAELLAAKLDELCSGDDKARCSPTTLKVIKKAVDDNVELSRLLDEAFADSPVVLDSTQQQIPSHK